MKIVMVGGHSRNIGKTSVVAGIIAALPELAWTAIKITQFGHGVCSVNGADCGCATAEHQFAITSERSRDSGTDTARFLAAGARRALWVRTKQGELVTALPSLRTEIANDQFVIVESNSLRRFLTPDLYLPVLDPGNPDFKLSAQELLDFASAFLIVTDDENQTDARAAIANSWPHISQSRWHNRPCFAVKAAENFISQPVIDFIKKSIG